MTESSVSSAARDETAPGLAPFSLKDAPAFIERQFPVGRLSAESYKERKAGAGQTLTAVGSYWKGRKPLILVRAVVLGCLLPATEDPAADLDIFLKLMAMDDAAFGRRFDGSAAEFARLFPAYAALVTDLRGRRTVWRDDLLPTDRIGRIADAFSTLPYADRLATERKVRRPEECDEVELLAPVWPEVNKHLGTHVASMAQLIELLGIARFGRRPRVADTFCGGGSIPFEAARLGCDVYASDLNPIAAMLTWGAFHIVGASKEKRAEVEAEQKRVAAGVETEITRLGIEHDSEGNRAKAYLYCLETRCPRTGWTVPMSPSWIVSTTHNAVARLVPNHASQSYDIDIVSGVSAAEMEEAEKGTVQGGRLVHPMNTERSGVEITTIRGDYRDSSGVPRNRLRLWDKGDFAPRPDDVFQERLYAIQWITRESIGKGRQETFFRAVLPEDKEREQKVDAIVYNHLAGWQRAGLVPDMPIEPGENTDQPIRARGWTHWHHLFGSRDLLRLSIVMQYTKKSPLLYPEFCSLIDFFSKLTQWILRFGGQGGSEFTSHVFSNQALNPFFNWGNRAWSSVEYVTNYRSYPIECIPKIETKLASAVSESAELFVTDPPYADAVNYQEITEFFIAWLRKNPPPPFDQWTWASQRELAIKGKDEQFRRDMVSAYAAMTRHMPDNGQQVVMFTHQDAGVWADLGSILWAAGLRVTAAWNIVTETPKANRSGNYVQGTVCLVLRKRLGTANARRMEIEAEIEDAVAAQLAHLNALDDAWHERTNAESLYTDGDLTLAAYAAALQVVTAYSSIDRQPLDRDLYRKLAKGETTMLRDLVDYAAQVANSLLVPEGFPRDMWRDLTAAERFYVRMLDMEARGSAKVADFQNFAKSFAFGGYADLMASTTANAASLAGAADLKGRMLEGEGFGGTQLRQVLFAIWKTMEGQEPDPKRGVTLLKAEYSADYWQRRQKLISLAGYIAIKTARTRPEESAAAHELAEALKLDRV
jgi:putative DNA methylase